MANSVSGAANLCQAEILWHLLVQTIYGWVQIACRVTAICSSLLAVGLCVWYGKKKVERISFPTDRTRLPLQNAQVSKVFTALLLANSAVYFGLSVGYMYLSTIAKPLLFRINSALCLLVFVFTCISLSVAWSKREALVAATWVKGPIFEPKLPLTYRMQAIFALSNLISGRFPVKLLYNRSRCGDCEDSEVGDSRPRGQDSSTELVPSPARDADCKPMGFR